MRGIVLIAMSISILAEYGMAAAISEKQHSGLRGNMELLSVQEPGLDRNDRIMCRGTLRNRVPSTNFLRIDSSIQVAPDMQSKSKRIEVDHDLYFVSSIAAIEYTKLFRFSAGLGPIISYERSTITIGPKSKSENFTDFGFIVRGDIDYAFNSDFEANFDLGWQSRSRAGKYDWSYGFGLGMNF